MNVAVAEVLDKNKGCVYNVFGCEIFLQANRSLNLTQITKEAGRFRFRAFDAEKPEVLWEEKA
jgi:hypothetical protein